MNIILSAAIILIYLATAWIFLFRGKERVLGKYPMGVLVFTSLLFTAGLDAGLVMLPLTEFPTYQKEAVYQFTNPAAIEFGFWGFLVWAFYFLTAWYFLKVEPVVKLFEVKFFNYLNNFVTIATCAFTASLFLSNLPTYIDGITKPQAWLLVSMVVAMAIFSSSRIVFIKYLATGSTLLFFALVTGMWVDSRMGLGGLGRNLALVADYFPNIHHFVLPLNDYHAFYLMWWFSWSIMIGQFIAKFAGNLSTRGMLVAMMIIPSIQLAAWFAVLYGYYSEAREVAQFWKTAMVVVGTIYVINSLDSLMRLYSDNMNWTRARLGIWVYAALNMALMLGLVFLYQFTPMKIEWVGMTVIFIYVCALIRIYMRRGDFKRPPPDGDKPHVEAELRGAEDVGL